MSYSRNGKTQTTIYFVQAKLMKLMDTLTMEKYEIIYFIGEKYKRSIRIVITYKLSEMIVNIMIMADGIVGIEIKFHSL